MMTMIVMTNYERLVRVAMPPWRSMQSIITVDGTIDVTILSTIMRRLPTQSGFLSVCSSKPMQSITIVGVTPTIVSSKVC